MHSSPLTHASLLDDRPNLNPQKLVAVVVFGPDGPGEIWTSTNSGETWTERATDLAEEWTSVASSSDGTVRQS